MIVDKTEIVVDKIERVVFNDMILIKIRDKGITDFFSSLYSVLW